MAKLTEYIVNLIRKQVKEKGIVVWYDPDRSYTDLARSLELSETTVLYYKDSFFRLRKEIDTWMEYLNRSSFNEGTKITYKINGVLQNTVCESAYTEIVFNRS